MMKRNVRERGSSVSGNMLQTGATGIIPGTFLSRIMGKDVLLQLCLPELVNSGKVCRTLCNQIRQYEGNI